MKRAFFVLLVPCVLAACDDKKTDVKTAASASASPSVSAAPVAVVPAPPTPPAASAAPIPSQAEASIAAAKEIAKANYKAELDKLDKEISSAK